MKSLPTMISPRMRSSILIIHTNVPAEIEGNSELRMSEIPETPPVEKLLGNLKK